GHPLARNSVCARVVRLAKQAGVRLTMHSLRRGFGCFYASKVPAQVLMKLMRHGDIKTTVRYYTNVDDAVEAGGLNRSLNTQPLAEQSGSAPQVISADISRVNGI